MRLVTKCLLIGLPLIGWVCGFSTGGALAQGGGTAEEKAIRLRFVAECMGPIADTSKLIFCNCSFTKLISRYGMKSYLQQDAIVRASNAKDLTQLARLAWEPEFRSCRTQ